jgi:hypothetical protein
VRIFDEMVAEPKLSNNSGSNEVSMRLAHRPPCAMPSGWHAKVPSLESSVV